VCIWFEVPNTLLVSTKCYGLLVLNQSTGESVDKVVERGEKCVAERGKSTMRAHQRKQGQ
jgi:hypothetical protein